MLKLFKIIINLLYEELGHPSFSIMKDVFHVNQILLKYIFYVFMNECFIWLRFTITHVGNGDEMHFDFTNIKTLIEYNETL